MSQEYSITNLLPPLVRFINELVAWACLLGAGITHDIFYLVLFVLSIALFATVSATGDVTKKTKVKIPGPLMLILEILAFGAGALAAGVLFGEIGLLGEVLLIAISYILDYERVLWLLGLKAEVPVTMSQFKKT